MKKKILFIYYQNIKPNGISKVLSNLVDELLDQKYDIEILFLMAPHEDFYPVNPKIKKHYTDSFAHRYSKFATYINKHFKFIPKIYNIHSYLYDLGSYKVLKEWVHENHHKYETIITCWYKLSAMLALDKRLSGKTIAWEHMSFTSGGVFWNKALRPYYKNLKNVVSTNIPGEKHYLNFNKKSLTIYNLMDNEVEKQPFIPAQEKKNIISVVARMDPEKNISEFVDIIAEAHLPEDWKVVIIGGGREEKKIRDEVFSKNLSHKIELLGNQNMDEVYKLLKSSKINCLTSTEEALPTILIQAMFFSNALIAYDCNYGPSDIINEKNGFLVPLHNKMAFIQKLETLTKNENLLNELIASSFEETQHWKKENIIQKWKKIL
ncbi:glycosyltransferase [Chryseobacterium sp. PS-8]|uniref:Glycosyltransferase n=1 Tax=Chryseobacterium indicum TaxID=2766954 RepID=A0ABS9CAF4_9FLAO|nr:glycosyltransferase [Chryseobacterium sp. PS-8]MCF2221280.1 glycosyltransferase [Chryseobacterium sp. PS-8]